MKLYKKWYFPEDEEHFVKYLDELGVDEYQKKQRDASFKFLDSHRTAIDIGANIGLWSRDICKTFKKAILFEPFPKNIECLKKNLETFNNFEILEVALSNESGKIDLHYNDNNVGESTIRKNKLANFQDSMKVDVKRLDDYSFNEIDYIKIDVQFHELEVIQGAINTLTNNNPVLCIESARRNQEELEYVRSFASILEKLQYKIVGELGKELFFKK